MSLVVPGRWRGGEGEGRDGGGWVPGQGFRGDAEHGRGGQDRPVSEYGPGYPGGCPGGAWGAWPVVRAWPAKNAVRLVASPRVKVAAARASGLAARTWPRWGMAMRLVRIIPGEFSELMQSTPGTVMLSWARVIRLRLFAVGSQFSLPARLLVA